MAYFSDISKIAAQLRKTAETIADNVALEESPHQGKASQFGIANSSYAENIDAKRKVQNEFKPENEKPNVKEFEDSQWIHSRIYNRKLGVLTITFDPIATNFKLPVTLGVMGPPVPPSFVQAFDSADSKGYFYLQYIAQHWRNPRTGEKIENTGRLFDMIDTTSYVEAINDMEDVGRDWQMVALNGLEGTTNDIFTSEVMGVFVKKYMKSFFKKYLKRSAKKFVYNNQDLRAVKLFSKAFASDGKIMKAVRGTKMSIEVLKNPEVISNKIANQISRTVKRTTVKASRKVAATGGRPGKAIIAGTLTVLQIKQMVNDINKFAQAMERAGFDVKGELKTENGTITILAMGRVAKKTSQKLMKDVIMKGKALGAIRDTAKAMRSRGRNRLSEERAAQKEWDKMVRQDKKQAVRDELGEMSKKRSKSF